MSPEQEADAMRMCLAEAGYPNAVIVLEDNGDGFGLEPEVYDVPDWAVWQAWQLIDPVNAHPCFDCWRDGTWPDPCPHVEAEAS